MHKKILIFIILGFFLISFVSAVEVSYCCERTTDGASCIETAEANCDSGFRKAPTSCSSTSYCRLGTCINGEDGICLPNVPQVVCQEEGGYWMDKDKDDIPQCELGCCLMGEQAAFVTQTRCESLTSLYGLEVDFRENIGSELECLALASPREKGACVYEQETGRRCKLTTRAECHEIKINADYSNVKFHDGYLCSAEELATSCGPSKKTTCVEGKDEVYFLDTCGNLANVYDASKYPVDDTESQNYWTYIAEQKDDMEICSLDSNLGNSDTCGNCNTFLSSTCMRYERGFRPTYGNYVCGSLDCKDSDFSSQYGSEPKHGEQWCVSNSGDLDDVYPGTEYFKLSCFNGEVTVENAQPWRAQICVQGEIEIEGEDEPFVTAAFRTNRWQDCAFQDNQEDCEDEVSRDCEWVEGPEEFSILKNERGKSLAKDEDGDKTWASCVPEYPPAFDFWENDTEAAEECSKATTTCVVKFEKGLLEWGAFNKDDCVKNCECLEDSWETDMNDICVAMGDCGSSVNYIGEEGYHQEDVITTKKVKK